MTTNRRMFQKFSKSPAGRSSDESSRRDSELLADRIWAGAVAHSAKFAGRSNESVRQRVSLRLPVHLVGGSGVHQQRVPEEFVDRDEPDDLHRGAVYSLSLIHI